MMTKYMVYTILDTIPQYPECRFIYTCKIIIAYTRGAQPFLSHEPFQKSIKPNEPTASRVDNMETVSDMYHIHSCISAGKNTKAKSLSGCHATEWHIVDGRFYLWFIWE